MTKRKFFQIRKTNESGIGVGDFYSPQRDLAYIGPNIAKIALSRLENPDTIYPAVAAIISYYRITESELNEAAKKLAAVYNNINEPASEDLLILSDFGKMRSSVQVVILAQMGAVLLNAVRASVMDVTFSSEPPRTVQEITEIADHLFCRESHRNFFHRILQYLKIRWRIFRHKCEKD